MISVQLLNMSFGRYTSIKHNIAHSGTTSERQNMISASSCVTADKMDISADLKACGQRTAKPFEIIQYIFCRLFGSGKFIPMCGVRRTRVLYSGLCYQMYASYFVCVSLSKTDNLSTRSSRSSKFPLHVLDLKASIGFDSMYSTVK